MSDSDVRNQGRGKTAGPDRLGPAIDRDSEGAPPAASPIERRRFLHTVGGSVAGVSLANLLAACGGGSGSGPSGPDGGSGSGGTGGSGGFAFSGRGTANYQVVIDLTHSDAAALDNFPSALFLRDPAAASAGSGTGDVVVLRVSENEFRAFDRTCTHQQCLVNGFTGTQITCPCHGSRYNLSGAVVAGPAPSALTEFNLVHDAEANTLTVDL